MKKVVLILALISTVAHADWHADPTANFDASKLTTEQSSISWRRVDDVKGACTALAKSKGLNITFKDPNACSWYNKTQCIIITGKKTTIEHLGHEVRHCFQGEWH